MELLGDILETTLRLKRQHEASLMSRSNVVATGVGRKISDNEETDEIAVIVSVRKKVAVAQLTEADLIPKTLGSVKTDVIETGEIVAFQDPKQKMRPARPGVSIGHHLISAGTLGCLVRKADETLILSNNHVLANSNKAQVGDAIWQPGKADGGTAADQIGTLAQFVQMAFDGEAPPPSGCLSQLLALFGMGQPKAANEPGNNRVDCALARPTSPDLVTPDILNIGVPIGLGTATLGTSLQKSGRTTGHTTGSVQQIDVTVSVNYGGPVATFTGQLMAGAMSQGGDSGSAVLDMDKRVVGLLFAGSASTTIINPISYVFDLLGIDELVT